MYFYDKLCTGRSQGFLVGLCRRDLCEAIPKMHSVFKFSDNLSALSQMDPHRSHFRSGLHFCQIFRSGLPLVRCTPRMRLQVGWHLVRPNPLAETSFGQVWYYCGLDWSHIPPTGEALCQIDIWSDFFHRIWFVIIKVVPWKSYLGTVIHQIDGGWICINWSGEKIALIAFLYIWARICD